MKGYPTKITKATDTECAFYAPRAYASGCVALIDGKCEGCSFFKTPEQLAASRKKYGWKRCGRRPAEKNEKRDHKIMILLEQTFLEMLREEAKSAGVAVNEYVHRAIEFYMNKEKDNDI